MKEEVKSPLKMDPVINEETANNELEAWFNYRKVRPDLRVNKNEITGKDSQRQTLISAFMYGLLTFDPASGCLNQKLEFPPVKKESDEIVFSQLKFKPRITRLEVLQCSKGIKPTDVEGKQAAYLSAITTQPIGLLNKMDESDRSLSDIIIGYFLQ